MPSLDTLSPVGTRSVGAARAALRTVVAGFRGQDRPGGRATPRRRGPVDARPAADGAAPIEILAWAAASGDTARLGVGLAEAAAAATGAAGAATLRRDGDGALVELGRWRSAGSSRAPAGIDVAARRGAVRLGTDAGPRLVCDGALVAPVRVRGTHWATIACWGVADAHHALDRLARLVTAAEPSVDGALERIALSERACEEAVLRRIATAVAAGRPLPEIDAMVVDEAVALLGADGGAIVLVPRPDARGHAHRAAARAIRDARAARSAAAPRPDDDCACGAAVPIRVGGVVRGALGVERAAGGPLPPATERRLAAFAELAAIALGNAERSRALSAEAREDELTGIANRRAFTERLAGEVGRARRYAGPLSLVLIDLDRFKRVNDTLGHQVGDAVLVETTRRLKALVRGGELVARIGGDELAWLLPETGVEGAVRAAERAIEAIRTRTFGPAGRITASAGVAGLQPGDGPSELVGRADGALLRAKADGEGTVRRSDAADPTESPPPGRYESPAR